MIKFLSWIGKTYNGNAVLYGVVCLLSTDYVRWYGMDEEYLRNFLNSTKDEGFSHIVIVTNRWEEVGKKHGEARELDLYHHLWKTLITEGSSILRLGQTQASALRILRLLISGDRLKLLKSQREPDDEPCSTPQLRTAQAFIETSLEQKEMRERLLKSQREPWSIAQMETTQAFIENNLEQKERLEQHRKEHLNEIQAATKDIEHRTEKQSGEKAVPIRTKDKTVPRTATEKTLDLQTQIDLEMEERIDPIGSFHVKQPNIEHPKIEHPKIELSDFEHPKIELPDLELSDLELSDFEDLNFELPNFDDFELSSFKHSNIEHSNFEHSKIEHSKIEHPKIDHPKIEHPKIEQHKVKLKCKPHNSSDGEYPPDSLKSNLARNQNRSRAGVTITGEREVKTNNAEIKSISHQLRLMHQNRVATREEIYQSSLYEVRSRLRSSDQKKPQYLIKS